MAYAHVGPAQRRQGVYTNSPWSAADLPLVNSKYDYKVNDVLVGATLTETYHARTKVAKDLSYIFEIPTEASVTGFSAKVGGSHTSVEGKVHEKGAADKLYKADVKADIQVWELDKLNEDVFHISLGKVSPNTTVEISVHYAYIISSDITPESIRITIPCGLEARPGSHGASPSLKVPTAPAGPYAVAITVGFHGLDNADVNAVTCTSGHAIEQRLGFSDDSYKRLKTQTEVKKNRDDSKAYVTYSSKAFLIKSFVLVFHVSHIDQPHCLVEKLHSVAQGQKQTQACVLTLDSNIELAQDTHEYIFLVDRSGSMTSGSRTQVANDVVMHMLRNIPNQASSLFDIYDFTTTSKSILSQKGSLPHDKHNVAEAERKLSAPAAHGANNIDAALKNVLKRRNHSTPHCSIIVVSDGNDWRIHEAMKTVQQATSDAAKQSKLLRVFVMGVGNRISRGMCEGLARVGSGATAYVGEELVHDRDQLERKAETLINTISLAPIRVTKVDWGIAPNSHTSAAHHVADGENHSSRPEPDSSKLGPLDKGQNLPPPQAIQQVPELGTLFWGIRSTWYAIIDGTIDKPYARVTYEIAGKTNSTHHIDFKYGKPRKGRLVHSIAARAMIQTFEDEMDHLTGNAKYTKEAEVIRLGTTYGLASTQTSFVAAAGGHELHGTKAYGPTPPSGNTSHLGQPHSKNNVPSSQYRSVKTKPIKNAAY